MRKLSEIDFFGKGYTVANPTFDAFTKLSGSHLIEAS